jgi:phasin family protein
VQPAAEKAVAGPKPAVTPAPVKVEAPKVETPKPVVAESKSEPGRGQAGRAKVEPAKVEPVAAKPAPKPEPVKPAEPVKAPEAKAPAPKLAPVAKAPPAKPVEAPPRSRPNRACPKAAAPASPATPAQPTVKPKEPAMTTLPTFDVPEAFKTAFADFQEKAKAAYEKSTASAADYSEFAKGNVEALVEAGKILTSGLQELGTALVADSREAFEALTGEVKSLAGAKTPTDFFQLQSDLLKKHFDKSVAFSSKQSEAVLKLASEAVAPISGRVSLAVDKIKAAA